MTNAEKQAAWRARREAELDKLRTRVRDLEQGASNAQAALNAKEREELIMRRRMDPIREQSYKRTVDDLMAKHAKELEKLRRAVDGVRPAAAYPNMPKPRSYTQEEWRKRLMKLCHPDKYHGSNLEPLANEVSAWLNSLKPKK